MEVILRQRVEKLGKIGEVVNVRSGYARNFLLPKKIAILATKANLEVFEKERTHLEQLNLKLKDEAEILKKLLEGKVVVLVRQASETGQLYGSVSARDIAEEVQHPSIKKQHVRIDHPIKTIGVHAVHLQLHPEVQLTIGINVAKSEDEAAVQAQAFEEILNPASPEATA